MFIYEELLKLAKKKIDLRMQLNDPASEYHEACFTNEEGKYSDRQEKFDGSTWTRSFLTGAVAYMYYHFKEQKYLDYLEKSYKVYDDFLMTTKRLPHDAGFNYILYALAWYKVSGDDRAYRMARTASNEYAKRFVFGANICQGFGWYNDIASTIIDDMMNNCILMWAYKDKGHPFEKHIFTKHINTVLKYMLRDDYTFKHSFAFDAVTGESLGERNICGFSNGSVWARGQAWGLFGLVNALEATDDIGNYISIIDGIVNKVYDMYPENGIPNWDLGEIGHIEKMPDTSAAVITASALLKMQKYDNNHEYPPIYTRKGIEKCGEFADKILETVVAEYLADEDKENILEGAQCGKFTTGAVWGDYFFIECLMRKIYGDECPDFWC